MARKPKIERFNEKILSRFQIYNSLFLTLPFKNIKRTSLLLPLFADHCQQQFGLKKNPNEIVKLFLSFLYQT
jgi:phosphoenolpyruvate carboxylase